MADSLAEIKKKLQDLGISTNTPGLVGDDRREELLYRLEVATSAKSNQNEYTQSSKGGNVSNTNNIPSLSHLSISEIRARLVSLGENTSTPGLVGEERKLELMKRLVAAICVNDSEKSDEILDSIVSDVIEKTPEPEIPPVVKEVKPAPAPIEPIAAPQVAPEPAKVVSIPPPPPRVKVEAKPEKPVLSSAQISELKNEMKRIANRRALAIADRLSGNNQDMYLQKLEGEVRKIDTELTRLKSQKGRSNRQTSVINNTHLGTEKASSVLVDNGKMLTTDKLLTRLEMMKNETKDQIRLYRLQVRQEEEAHPEYGLQVEESLQAKIGDANKDVAVSRVKKRVDELRTIDKMYSESDQDIADQQTDAINRSDSKYILASKQQYNQTEQKPTSNATVSNIPNLESKKVASAVENNNKSPSADMPPSEQNSGRGRSLLDMFAQIEMEEQMFRQNISSSVDVAKPKNELKSHVGNERSESKGHARNNLMDLMKSAESLVSDSDSDGSHHDLKASTMPQSPGKPLKPPPPELKAKFVPRPDSKAANNVENKSEYDDSNNNFWGKDKAENISPKHVKSPMKSPTQKHFRNDEKSYDSDASDEAESDEDESEQSEGEEKLDRITPAPRSLRPPPPSNPPGPPSNAPVPAASTSLVRSSSSQDNQERENGHVTPKQVHSRPKQFENRIDNHSDDDESSGDEVVKSREELKQSSSSHALRAQSLRPPEKSVSPTKPSLDRNDNSAQSSPEKSQFDNVRTSGDATDEEFIKAMDRFLSDDDDDDQLTEQKSNQEDKMKSNPIHQVPKSSHQNVEDDEDGGFNEDEDDGDDDEDDDDEQIRTLIAHAKMMEDRGDIATAEETFERALQLDPTHTKCLNQFAMFLHSKKGELARAEGFFLRGVQSCLPSFAPKVAKIIKSNGLNAPSPNKPTPFGELQSNGRNQVKTIVTLLLTFATFLDRAKGDMEGSLVLYRKAIELAPDNARVLATVAHFFSEEGSHKDEALQLFESCLKVNPGNPIYLMWYAKALRKSGQIGKAELMYRVALDRSVGNLRLHPMAICNYATFVFKFKKLPDKALVMFEDGLKSYPKHKGLVKNYTSLKKKFQNSKNM